MIEKLVLSALVVSVMSLSGIEGSRENNCHASDKVTATQLTSNKQHYPIRGEIRQTYQLAPNANIEVTGIEGSAEVETTSGDTAEIHFVREARTQADYDCETIVVLHSPTNLVVQHQTRTGTRCRMIEAREQIHLVVPRSANLNFHNIEGGVSVGTTDGLLRLNNIEGSVQVGQTQAAEISWIENDLSLNVSRVSSEGINVSNIEGAVELAVSKDLNADLSVVGRSENIQVDIPNMPTSGSGRKDYRLQLGTGGAPITISRIEGGVRIRPRSR
jgi:hypothetical protein